MRDAHTWLRSRGPVTLAAALLLEVSSATTPSGPHARALLRAALLGLVLFVVLIAAAVDGAVARALVALRGASATALAWLRTTVLGHALPAPVPSSLLLDKAGRPLRGGARAARMASIERDRARRIRERSLRGRAEVALARVSSVAGPTARRLGRVGIALESRVLAARSWTIAASRSAAQFARPWLERRALAVRGRSRATWLALRAGLEPRAAAARRLVAPLRARLAQERAALPARAEAALRSARLATAIASRSTGRALSAIPVPAIPVPTLPVRTLRVVTLGLLFSFVFATAIGTTGLVASRGSVALGASTTLAIISGEVLVNESGSAEFRVAADGEILQAGSTIKTGPDAYAILTYFEGSTVSIDPNTVLVIESLLANPDGSTIIGMRQDVGQTWHAVTKLLTAGSKYEVRTPTATATVRGTLFLVGVVPGADPNIPETVIETTEGAVAAERPPTVDTPQGEEIVVPAGFQVRAKAAEAIPPAVPAPEPERKVTVTVGAGNSLVVDPQGRANGEKDGKIIVQTPGAKVEKVEGRIVVTLPNTTDGKISTIVQQADGDDEQTEPPAPVQITTVVQERGRGESRTEETVQPTTQGPAVTGVDIKKGVEGGSAPPDVRRLDESEKQEAPKVKVAEAPAPPAPPVARADQQPSGDRGQSPGGTQSSGQERGDRGGSGGGEPPSAPSPSAEPKRGIVNAIVTLTLPPLSAEELAKREREQREADERDRRDRERRDEERRREEEQKVAELRRQEQQARAEVSRIGGEREREETRRDERREERRNEEPAPSPAGVIEQIFRAVSAPGRDDDRRVNELRKAEEEAAKKAEEASEERRRAEQRLREATIRAEEEKRKEAERRAEELRRAEEKAKQDEERKLEELRRIEEKAREQAAKLEAEQRREAERRLQEFREAEERKRREEARALEEQRRAEERARDEAERRLRELRRQEEEARERERERQRERDRERDDSRERGGFTPRETLKPLPGVGTRSVEEEQQRTEQLRERSDRQEAKRDAERSGEGEKTRDEERPDREARGRDGDG